MSTTNGKKSRTTILRLEVRDFQGIRAALLEHLPAKGLVRVTGANGAGKSSILKAISGCLGGAAQVHERAIRDGAEDGAKVDLELTDGFEIRKRHTEANPKGHLVVTGPDGGKYGQAKLNELVGPLSFDPQAFFGLNAKRQREVLLSIGKDPELATKLDDVRARRQAIYDERTPWISQQRRARQVAKPEGERPEPIDTSAEMAKLRELQAQERERGDAWRARDQHERDRLARQNDVDAAEEDVKRKLARIEDLKRQLTLAEADLKVARDHVAECEHRRDQAEHLRDQAEVEWEAFPDPSDDIQAVQDRISQAEGVQRALKPWEAWDAAQSELGQAADKVAELTDAMEELEAEERRLVADAGIPVPGISFDEDGSPLLNGRPLELASGGERIELAVRVALAVDPQLGICLVDEANDLDLEAIDRLNALADEHDFQIWLCRIGLEGPGEVVVAGGEAAMASAGDPEQPGLEL